MGKYVLELNLESKGYTLDNLAEWIGVQKQTAKDRIRGKSLFKEKEIEIISEKLKLTQKEKKALFGNPKDAEKRKKEMTLSVQLKNLSEPVEIERIETKPNDKERIRRGQFLKQKIKENGDTLTSLAQELCISRPTISYKVSEAKNGNSHFSFNSAEMVYISKKYSFTQKDFYSAFVGGHPDAYTLFETFDKKLFPEQNEMAEPKSKEKLSATRVTIKNTKTDEKKTFEAIIDACNYLGVSWVLIYNRLKGISKKRTILDKNGEIWTIDYSSDCRKKIIILTNIKSDEEFEFNTVEEIGNYIGVSGDTIYRRLRYPEQYGPIVDKDGERWGVKYGYKEYAEVVDKNS